MTSGRDFAQSVVAGFGPTPAARVSTAAQPSAPDPTKREREPAGFKTHSTADWWEPPQNTPRNAGIPSVAQLVEDFMPPTVWRLFKFCTNPQGRDTGDPSGPAKGAKRRYKGKTFIGWSCDPGSFDKIALKVGMCKNTVKAGFKFMLSRGILRDTPLLAGKRRVRTLYFAPEFGAVLHGLRERADLFHTNHKRSCVVRGRGKHLMTVADGVTWKLNAAKAPVRGTGKRREDWMPDAAADAAATALAAAAAAAADTVRTEYERPAAPPPAKPDPVSADARLLHGALLAETEPRFVRYGGSICESGLEDAMKLLEVARREAEQFRLKVPVEVISVFVGALASEYEPNKQFPAPKVGWFLQKLPAKIAQWAKEENRLRSARDAIADPGKPPPRPIAQQLCRACAYVKQFFSDGRSTLCLCEASARRAAGGGVSVA